ncbi:glutaminyl-trna synthetase [Phaffia rhodozyma]|uniref:glutamine--tRNA ligase n=1 Tax=Phaffia rhodozyma TaxID=264483 RepID=A0A0F7SI40_PHARH|nr:glutaminyl-trna synthetase [Phaffia rhodozyma]
MPPKTPPTLNDVQKQTLETLTSVFCLPSARATELTVSPKLGPSAADLAGSSELRAYSWDEAKGKLLAGLITGGIKLDLETRVLLSSMVGSGRLGKSEQVSAAIKYFDERTATQINDDEFDKACGVGINFKPEEIPTLVSEALDVFSPSSWDDLSKALVAVKNTDLKWAGALDVKNAVEQSFVSRFGSKEAAREKKAKEPKAPKAASAAKKPVSSDATAADAARSMFTEGFLSRLHKPGGNKQIDPKLMEEHLKFTGGNVITRFPPEPNGFLHIGHSKAIAINFGYAAHHGGHTYLRYDDTNPQAEEGQYFESILEMVRWLGFEPWAVTYSSDYFQRLFDLGIELIKRDRAYVCHCSAEEQLKNRGGEKSQVRIACSHRSRPVEESIIEFERMRKGDYKKGEATLRMKQDLENGNPHMWDMVAYRIVPASHHRTGDEWCIYPTYDFTHCLVDSFENISHSLCTTEFILARESYEWLCDAVSVYKPRQSEYGRLNIQGTVMSKRKIKKLVDDGHVGSWDDPRIYTLIALRRRGVPPGAIVNFVQSLGVSTAPGTIQLAKFEGSVRSYLESSAPRLNFVLRPLKVTIENVADDYRVEASKPLHPKVPEMGSYPIVFTKHIYIDRDDFRLEDSKDYFRLAPGKTVGLFSAPHPITCTEVKKNEAGEVIEVVVRLETEGVKKPKAYIQWVAEDPISNSPVIVDETRIFNPLFHSDDPAALDDYLADLNPNSLVRVHGAMIEPAFYALAKRSMATALEEAKARTAKALREVKKDSTVEKKKDDDTPVATVDQLVGLEDIRFQGLRVAYFTVDNKESKLGCLNEGEDVVPGKREGDKLVLNRIVSLKEDTGKKSV